MQPQFDETQNEAQNRISFRIMSGLAKSWWWQSGCNLMLTATILARKKNIFVFAFVYFSIHWQIYPTDSIKWASLNAENAKPSTKHNQKYTNFSESKLKCSNGEAVSHTETGKEERRRIEESRDPELLLLLYQNAAMFLSTQNPVLNQRLLSLSLRCIEHWTLNTNKF